MHAFEVSEPVVGGAYGYGWDAGGGGRVYAMHLSMIRKAAWMTQAKVAEEYLRVWRGQERRSLVTERG
ncbi:hypothetical protein [Frankia sp. CIT1]|uniref:hypothetical protein n=1 Tax=Frankia sp. CIT1 TaxID=2880974 RepID=UPI001EF610EC|nr:hypothetical protein [Frankia sp. CIT1]